MKDSIDEAFAPKPKAVFQKKRHQQELEELNRQMDEEMAAQESANAKGATQPAGSAFLSSTSYLDEETRASLQNVGSPKRTNEEAYRVPDSASKKAVAFEKQGGSQKKMLKRASVVSGRASFAAGGGLPGAASTREPGPGTAREGVRKSIQGIFAAEEKPKPKEKPKRRGSFVPSTAMIDAQLRADSQSAVSSSTAV